MDGVLVEADEHELHNPRHGEEGEAEGDARPLPRWLRIQVGDDEHGDGQDGQDQRWAYVSASRWFSDTGEAGLDSRETAEKEIRQFLGNLADRNIDWQKINARPE